MKTFRRLLQLRIRKKIILIYLAVGVLPFALFSVYSYTQANRQIMTSESAMIHNALNQATLAVDTAFSRFNAVSNYLFNEPSILQAVNRTYGNDYFAMYRAYKYAITPVLSTYYALYADMVRMTIFTASDLLPFNNYTRGLELLQSEPWFPAVEGKFAPTWFVVGANGQTKLFSVRRIGIPSEYQVINYLYIEVNCDDVFAPLRNLSTDPYAVIVKDQSGNPVFVHNALDIQDTDARQELLTDEEAGIYRRIETRLKTNDWTVCYLSDPNSLFASVSRITASTYYSAWGVLVVLGIVATLFISWLIKPVEQLTRAIESIGKDTMEVTLTSDRADEVGILVRSFSEMMVRIRELINATYKSEIEKREYQQRLLSMQINPHFLYNSLSLINSKAILSNHMEISNMTVLLSRFYRTALNQGQDITTLRNEMNNIEAYVELQRLQCGGFFEVSYNVDAECLETNIPNFILQPVVENAIEHGLKQSDRALRLLHISACGSAEALCVIISDNGAGMEESAVQALLTEQTKGYGIKNVYDRLRLFYQERARILIRSDPGEGTVVQLWLPHAQI